MKKIIVLVSILLNLSCAFGLEKVNPRGNYDFEDGYAVVVLNGKCGVINKNLEICVKPTYETASNLGDGFFFVCDSKYSKFIIDAAGNRVNKEDIRRAHHGFDGKIPVEGYHDEEAGDTRIFDAKTGEFSEILPNLWILVGFYNDIACFSTRNVENKLKCVLVNTRLERVVDMEFDYFKQRNSSTGTWIMLENDKEVKIDKNGKLIQ